jgi:hypothetical protein
MISGLPTRTGDAAEARQILTDHGAVILTGRSSGSDAARQVAIDVFGDDILALPPAAPVRPGPENERRAADDGSKRGYAHTDGFAYGDALPDHFLLLVDHQCAVGGANFLVDGWQLIDDLTSHPSTTELAKDLMTIAIDQTETGMRASIAPIVLTGPDGARMVRRTIEQRPTAHSTRPLVDAAMIGAWHAAVEHAAHAAPSFRVEAGEALIVDNRRMLHGREPYTDPMRSLWRVWVWTPLSLAVPEGELHSDRRYAWTAPSPFDLSEAADRPEPAMEGSS